MVAIAPDVNGEGEQTGVVCRAYITACAKNTETLLIRAVCGVFPADVFGEVSLGILRSEHIAVTVGILAVGKSVIFAATLAGVSVVADIKVNSGWIFLIYA